MVFGPVEILPKSQVKYKFIERRLKYVLKYRPKPILYDQNACRVGTFSIRCSVVKFGITKKRFCPIRVADDFVSPTSDFGAYYHVENEQNRLISATNAAPNSGTYLSRG